MYSETPQIRTLMGLGNFVLNRGLSLLEGFIITEIKALVTESTVLIRGVSCQEGCPQIGVSLYKQDGVSGKKQC